MTVVPLSGAVLAGGRSRRFGGDKRFVPVDGVPLLVRTLQVVDALTDEVQVVAADVEDVALVRTHIGDAVPVRCDVRAGVGPAAGLEVALDTARHPLVLVVAADHPALSVAVLQLLVARARASEQLAVALCGEQGGEPFVAVYRRDALPTVRAALDAGVRRMQDVLDALDAELVARDEWLRVDPSGDTVRDVDVPADLGAFGRPAEQRAVPHRGRSGGPSAGT